MSFDRFMRQTLFEPLNLSCSTYENSVGPNAAEIYDAAGAPTHRFQYAAPSATGLSTCIRDMVQWVRAHVRPEASPAIDPKLLHSMREPHGKQLGFDIWGLGTMLYAPTAAGAFVYGHDGNNEPAINAAVRINPNNADALVVLSSGGRLLATRLASEWTYWQTGGPDFLVVGTAAKEAIVPLVAGWLMIVFVMLVFPKIRKRSRTFD